MRPLEEYEIGRSSLALDEVLKFNVDGATSKPSPAGIGEILQNSKGEVRVFSMNVGVKESNET